LKKTVLSIWIIILFTNTVVNPLGFGNYVEVNEKEIFSEITDQNKQLDELAFYCTTPNGFNELKFEYYKKQLLKKDSDEATKEQIILDSEELITIPNTPLITGLSDGPMDSAWPMKCHDVHHTGLSPFSTADNPGIEKWRFECDWMRDTPIISDDGTIYVGGGYNDIPWYLISINPNGTLKWRFKTDGLILGSSPAINEDGTIYVGSWDSYLYAIKPNGTLKWKVGTGASIGSSPAIGEDGIIYFGTLAPGNSIVAVNPNGTIKWSYPTGDRIYSDPCIGDDGTIYIGSNDQYLYAMNPNGTLKWRFKTGAAFAGSASIAADGTIYAAGSWDDHLYALYPNGTIKWKCNIWVNSNPSIDSDGTIYIGGDEKLYAVYPNGTVKWSFNLGNERWIAGSSPAISADSNIYFGTNIGDAGGGEIIAINPNGTEKWRKMIADEWVDSSPSISEDGTVYIGSAYDIKRGYLHAFGPIESNTPPEAPIISGETNGNVGQRYWYTFNSVDPDRNPISFYIEWGDGTTTGWTMERGSGENCYYDHTYSEADTYIIRAKAKDVMGEESDWGTLEVTMPRNKALYYSSFFMRFLERFPNAFQILRFVIRGW
jgi:outer membrane protein assembly factor BamB